MSVLKLLPDIKDISFVDFPLACAINGPGSTLGPMFLQQYENTSPVNGVLVTTWSFKSFFAMFGACISMSVPSKASVKFLLFGRKISRLPLILSDIA